MLVKIAKEFRWEMGHRLSYHKDGCQNLHGHSYKMAVELVGTQNEGGMVLDYGEIKTLITPLIESLDHSTMLHQDDQEVVAFMSKQNMKTVLVPFHPTAENIAIWFLNQLKPQLSAYNNLKNLTIRVHETATATAEVTTIL